jgi:hypothetical protein
MPYVPTGYGRGRPRKGEVRPPTAGGIAQAQLKKKRLTEDFEYWRAYYNEQQADWAARNPERAKQISTASSRRALGWKKLINAVKVDMAITEAQTMANVGPPNKA